MPNTVLQQFQSETVSSPVRKPVGTERSPSSARPGHRGRMGTTSRVDPESIRRVRKRQGGSPGVWARIDRGNLPVDYTRSVENLAGRLEMPVGMAGPVRVVGSAANGEYPLPLATTEAALVASCHRGCLAINQAGGCRAVVTAEGLARVPGFVFATVLEAARFLSWTEEHFDELSSITAGTSRYCRLKSVSGFVEGNHVFLRLVFSTGDAAGQNMATIASEEICRWLADRFGDTVRGYYVESNASGDKKAASSSFQSVRGKKVTAEVNLSEDLVRRRLRTTPRQMEEYWKMAAVGSMVAGSVGVQGHYANLLAGIFLATGQDVACVSEASVGVTRMEVAEDGSLYASVTLPNMIVGTVGGGTGLPMQGGYLELMGLQGAGCAKALAEVIGAACLAGDLSIIAALAAGHFTSAHRKRARDPIRNPRPVEGGESEVSQ